MTNYERIKIDKAFCAWLVTEMHGEMTLDQAVKWLDKEQVEVSDERAQEGK